jgi:peptide/nickel transport system ATP-binding protein
MTSLTVRNLVASVQSSEGFTRILTSVSLDVRKGEAVALVGESGSGKSVTLRSLGGLLPSNFQVSGRLDVCGIDVLTADDRALAALRTKHLAYVFQDPRSVVNPVHRVGDFLTERMRKVDRLPAPIMQERALRALHEVSLPDPERVLTMYPHELSGGMLQRVVICSALLAEPDFILADEPTTALDVTTQAEVLGILDRSRRDRGLGLLFVTHDLDLAVAICDRVLVMYAGAIVEEFSTTDGADGAVHPYTLDLFSTRPTMTGPKSLAPIPGRAISADESSTACSYAPRCSRATSICSVQPAPWIATAFGRAACHHLTTSSEVPSLSSAMKSYGGDHAQ